MSEESLGSISQFFQQLQLTGDAESANEIWSRFFPRLLGLSKKVLSGRDFPMGAEDSVQEAFFQFFASVQSGKYSHAMNREDLWRVLCMITVQKSRRQLVREGALKRGQGHVTLESQWQKPNGQPFRLDEVIATVPTAEWDLVIAEMLEELSDELKNVAILRLAGYTNTQIKETLFCSLRSVERRMQIIRATWQPHWSTEK